mgnify:FL=1
MTIQDKIIKKLDNELYPDLTADMVYKLSNESERGAILIGTSKIEEYLEIFILKILPESSNSYTKRLTNYPGPLSSLSSKIELLYGFRYINKEFRESLNKLKKLRNQAAHSYDNFSLTENSELIYEITAFMEDIGYVVNEISMKSLLKLKKSKMEKIYAGKKIEIDYDYIESTLKEFKTSKDGKRQHRIWQLSYGIVFMCLYVLVLMDENDNLKDKNLTHPIKQLYDRVHVTKLERFDLKSEFCLCFTNFTFKLIILLY